MELKGSNDNSNSGNSPIEISKKAPLSDHFDLTAFYPTPERPVITDSLPENVERTLIEAEAAYSAGLYTAAASCYRKSMERATKALLPDAKGMLNARIRQIEKDGLLPRAMIELLDQVRIFANEAVHDDEVDPTKEDCAGAREFCQLFLTYAFSLPAKIDVAKKKATEPS